MNINRMIGRRLGIAMLAIPLACHAHAGSTTGTPPNAIDSDPARLGWMVGSPPAADRTLRFDDGSYFRFPEMRWSVANFRQLMPTVNVSRGLGNPGKLKRKLRGDIDALTFTPLNGSEPMTWEQSLLANYTDGIVVMHKGRIVYERYFGVLKADGQHGAMSAEVWAHAAAGNPLPKPKDYSGPRSYYEFLVSVKPEGNHGDAFHYRTANTDALGWVLARVSGQSVAQLLSERIWRKIGAEQDAYMSVDSTATPFAGGGLNAGLRDLARFGELMRNDGRYHGQQVVPKSAIDDIRAGGKKEDFAKAGYALLPGWSYRNMWWVTHNDHGAFMARGVHGQALYVDPAAEMVIARFASHPVAGNAANDPTSLPAYEALAKHLMGKK